MLWLKCWEIPKLYAKRIFKNFRDSILPRGQIPLAEARLEYIRLLPIGRTINKMLLPPPGLCLLLTWYLMKEARDLFCVLKEMLQTTAISRCVKLQLMEIRKFFFCWYFLLFFRWSILLSLLLQVQTYVPLPFSLFKAHCLGALIVFIVWMVISFKYSFLYMYSTVQHGIAVCTVTIAFP